MLLEFSFLGEKIPLMQFEYYRLKGPRLLTYFTQIFYYLFSICIL